MPVTRDLSVKRIMENTSMAQVRRRELIEDFGYNVVGGMPTDIFNPVQQSAMIRDAYYMWIKNPLANSMIELFLDFVFGDGVMYEAKDPRVKEILDEYWNDTDNDWENKSIERYRDMSLYGELILETHPLEGTGRVKVQSIYPDIIQKINRHPAYKERVQSITITQNDEEIVKEIVHFDNIQKKYIGDTFLFQINKSTFQSRGISDLFVNRDWLRLYDKSLFATMERIGLLLSFVWDITIKGAEEEELQKKFQQIVNNPPRPGGFRVHNENEEWDEKTPSLQGRDFQEVYGLMKSQIIGGSRQPEHYFGVGGNVNMATAREMNKPFNKKVKRRQRFIKHTFKQQFDFVIGKAIEHNRLDEDVDTTYTINMMDPNEDAAIQMSDTILKFSQSLVLLETNGYIDKKTAKNVIDLMINQLGIVEAESPEDVEGEKNENKEIMEAVSKHMKKYKETIGRTKESKKRKK